MSEHLYCKLIETEKLDEIFNHLSLDTLVISDIDNTLIETDQHLGSVQWGENLISKLIASGESPEKAHRSIHDHWLAILPNANMRLIDEKTPSIFHQIRQKGVTLMGLTARHPLEASFTHPQLHKVGLHFDYQDGNSHETFPLNHAATYDKGILFCGIRNKKSDVLLSYLDKKNYKPKRVIFIDDKWDHVIDLEKALTAHHIDYVGIRLSKTDKRVKEYHDTIADIQWKSFPSIISDEEAYKLLKTMRR